MERVSVNWACPRCGFESAGAIEVPEQTAECWLEVRAAGFQPHLSDPGLHAIRASRAEARRDRGALEVRGSCPRCGDAVNLLTG